MAPLKSPHKSPRVVLSPLKPHQLKLAVKPKTTKADKERNDVPKKEKPKDDHAEKRSKPKHEKENEVPSRDKGHSKIKEDRKRSRPMQDDEHEQPKKLKTDEATQPMVITDQQTLETVVSTTVAAVASSIAAAARFQPVPPSHDVGLVAAELQSTNSSLSSIAASLETLTRGFNDDCRARRHQIDVLLETKGTISSLAETVRQEINTNRGLVRTFIEGQRAVCNQLSIQAEAFRKLTSRLDGIVEDDLRGGQVGSLVKKILGVSNPSAAQPRPVETNTSSTSKPPASDRSPDRGNYEAQMRNIRQQQKKHR